VAAEDGTIAALLGASPGASVTVSIMLDLIRRCFPEQADSAEWRSKLDEIFPAMADVLTKDAERYREVQAQSNQRLQLDQPSA
jgi:malate dehydrogenase (quinone)